jgi:hypothetical protein
MRRLALALIAIATLFAFAPSAHAQGDSQAASAAVAWLRGQQQADGSFPGFGAGDTADALVALVAAGEDSAGIAAGGSSAIDYLAAQAPVYAATGPGAAAKLALAAVAAGADPTNFGDTNLLQLIGASYDPQRGQYGSDVYGHALALLAIKAVGATPPEAAVARTLGLQLEDGGWSFDGSADTGSDTNTTGLVVQALAGTTAAIDALARAADYLKGQQNDDGGFPYSQSSQFGNASDANSTAAALQAIIALGQDPAGADWSKDGNTPLAALVALQNPSGAFRYQAAQAEDNALATYQAVPALLGKTLPVTTRTVAGAQELIAPAGAPSGAPSPATLPATGAPSELLAGALVIVGMGLAAAGIGLRRRFAL